MFVVLDPGSGHATADQVRGVLDRLWADFGHGDAMHDLSPGDDLGAVVAVALRHESTS